LNNDESFAFARSGATPYQVRGKPRIKYGASCGNLTLNKTPFFIQRLLRFARKDRLSDVSTFILTSVIERRY
ncbi:MAG: hypothetical protein Q8O16_04215, partial [Dehalococcoidia bacterium]|nr:hypothetical protein [Dehalococcoidia bacterium]